MADMMDTLKGLLGDDADEKLSNIMQILNPDSSATAPSTTPEPPQNSDLGDTITPEMLMAAQSIIGSMSKNGDDERTKLLKSLKPFMRKERQDTIDSAVKMLNLAHLSQFFKGVI